MTANLILIASYPKSGNTWTRMVFEKLRHGLEFSLNNLDGSFQGIHRRMLFDRMFPVNAAELWPEEVENMLPSMYRQLSAETAGQAIIKVHDNVRRTPSGEWVYPPECVSAAIYLTRHPFDVAVSNANHFGIGIESAIAFLAEDVTPGIATWLPESLDQYFGTWSQNVSSWLDRAPYPLAVARYEDLLADPIPEFARLARAAGFSAAPDEIARAVEASGFAQLQTEETRYGFNERPDTCSLFFRSGRLRSWEGVLDEALREQLLRDHGAVMRRMGYTADGGVGPWKWEKA